MHREALGQAGEGSPRSDTLPRLPCIPPGGSGRPSLGVVAPHIGQGREPRTSLGSGNLENFRQLALPPCTVAPHIGQGGEPRTSRALGT